MRLDFEKTEDGWFVVLPTYQGSKADLQMVMGADTMLDIISEGEVLVRTNIETAYFDDMPIPMAILTKNKLKTMEGWTDYKCDWNIQGLNKLDVSLCPVLHFVFPETPKEILIYKLS